MVLVIALSDHHRGRASRFEAPFVHLRAKSRYCAVESGVTGRIFLL